MDSDKRKIRNKHFSSREPGNRLSFILESVPEGSHLQFSQCHENLCPVDSLYIIADYFCIRFRKGQRENLMKRRQKRNQYIIKIAAVMLLMLLLWIAVFYRIIDSGDFLFSFCVNTRPIASEENGWNLILVNCNNYIPDDYEIELTELSNGEKVDSRIYPQLQEMFDDMRAEGLYPIVREGYRSAEEQEEIFAEKVQAYMNEGYFRSRAERMAEEWVAVPGTSEHQLGIAVDINADKERCENEDVYLWLAENAYKYGFILRYPQGKEDITGISYEPWHFRYVGVENAQIIYEKQICLEEFIENIR